MKKLIIVLFSSILVLTGCNGEEASTTSTDLLEVESIQRPMTAVSVSDQDTYDFAISDTLIEGIDTFNLGSNLNVKFSNTDSYTIYYSDSQDFSDEDILSEVSSTPDAEYDVEANAGYYRITSEGSDIEAVVSVN